MWMNLVQLNSNRNICRNERNFLKNEQLILLDSVRTKIQDKIEITRNE